MKKIRMQKKSMKTNGWGILSHCTGLTGNVAEFRLDDESSFHPEIMLEVEHVAGPGRYSLPERWFPNKMDAWVMAYPGTQHAMTFDLCCPASETVMERAMEAGYMAGCPMQDMYWDIMRAGYVPVTYNTIVWERGEVWKGGLDITAPSFTSEPEPPYLMSNVDIRGALMQEGAAMSYLAVVERYIAKQLLLLSQEDRDELTGDGP